MIPIVVWGVESMLLPRHIQTCRASDGTFISLWRRLWIQVKSKSHMPHRNVIGTCSVYFTSFHICLLCSALLHPPSIYRSLINRRHFSLFCCLIISSPTLNPNPPSTHPFFQGSICTSSTPYPPYLALLYTPHVTTIILSAVKGVSLTTCSSSFAPSLMVFCRLC